MIPNFLVLAAAALIPLFVGAIWYNPKVGFGLTWMKAATMTEEKIASSNMVPIFILTYVFSFLIAIGLLGVVIHQMGLYSTLAGEPGFMEPGSEVNDYFENFMATYGDRFRTFKHGALHGALAAIFLALPIVGINALFERRGFKYIALHVGYWLVSFTLMGGVICQWALPI